MPRYMVNENNLSIRTGPSVSYECVGKYYRGEIINSGGYPFEGEI